MKLLVLTANNDYERRTATFPVNTQGLDAAAGASSMLESHGYTVEADIVEVYLVDPTAQVQSTTLVDLGPKTN